MRGYSEANNRDSVGLAFEGKTGKLFNDQAAQE